MCRRGETMTTRLTCNFQGRLGNLMFEVATVLATAWTQELTPCFQLEECDYYKGIRAFQQYLKPMLADYAHWLDPRPFAVYDESVHNYTPLPAFERDTMLKGYFTTSRYFSAHRHRIIEEFTKRDKSRVDAIANDIRRSHKGRRIVAAHVRRTDYVTDYHWELPLSYYEQAASLFPGAVFVIFTDDYPWAESNLRFMTDRQFVRERDYIEMQLMGACSDANIIANSTFSAWGAMLGDPDMTKTVVSPARWVPEGRGTHNRDIWEPHWTRI
jgi:hypothetical protein